MKDTFIKKISDIYSGTDLKIVLDGLKTEKRPVNFRVNTLKSTIQEVESALEEENISYIKIDTFPGMYQLTGEQIESDLWKLDIYTTGKIYLQSFSSQLPVHFFGTTDEKINILDATAAPGGKTLQLSEQYPNATIYAVEKSQIRYEKLLHNIKKMGAKNIQAYHQDIVNMRESIPKNILFDKILLDVPCSSEGRFNIDAEDCFKHWDHVTNRRYFKIQKTIVDSVISSLKPGGELIYSTCTLSTEENEGMVHYLLCNYPELSLEPLPLDHDSVRPGVTQSGKKIYKKETTGCIRCLPSSESEGFFIAKFLKQPS